MARADRGTAVLVPIKAFSQAKKRLAPKLSPQERAELAREMARHVLRVAKPLPTQKRKGACQVAALGAK